MEFDEVFEKALYGALEDFARQYKENPREREKIDSIVSDMLYLAVPCHDAREKYMTYYGSLTAEDE